MQTQNIQYIADITQASALENIYYVVTILGTMIVIMGAISAIWRYKTATSLDELMSEGADQVVFQFGRVAEQFANMVLTLILINVLFVLFAELSKLNNIVFTIALWVTLIGIIVAGLGIALICILVSFDSMVPRHKKTRVIIKYTKIAVAISLLFVITPWALKHTIFSRENAIKLVSEFGKSHWEFLITTIQLIIKTVLTVILEWAILLYLGMDGLKIRWKAQFSEYMISNNKTRYVVYRIKDGNIICGENPDQSQQNELIIKPIGDLGEYKLCKIDNAPAKSNKKAFCKALSKNPHRIIKINIDKPDKNNYVSRNNYLLGDKMARVNINQIPESKRELEIWIECEDECRAEIAAWRLWSWGFNQIKWCAN